MTYRPAFAAGCVSGLVLLFAPASAAPLAACNTNFTVCGIPENVSLQLPFTAIAGDVILTEPGTTVVSDVFRIFNNVVNTGGGTGLGNMIFLYSSDETALPGPATYSANAVFTTENPSGITPFLGNGTTFLLGVPEPRTFEMFTFGFAAFAAVLRRRQRRLEGGL